MRCRPALDGMFWKAAWTIVIATVMQTVAVGFWLWRTEPAVFSEMRPNAKIATFIGCTSAVGSMAWYTAFAMQNASYVRAVGQIEVVFTLLDRVVLFSRTDDVVGALGRSSDGSWNTDVSVGRVNIRPCARLYRMFGH